MEQELGFSYPRHSHRRRCLGLYPRNLLTLVVLTIGFTWYYEWDKAGVMILGEVETGKFAVKWPISWSMITDPKFNFRSVLSSAMVVAILGFFESMVGVKHLAIVENQVSKANRELVALGAVNGVVCTSPLPGFPFGSLCSIGDGLLQRLFLGYLFMVGWHGVRLMSIREPRRSSPVLHCHFSPFSLLNTS